MAPTRYVTIRRRIANQNVMAVREARRAARAMRRCKESEAVGRRLRAQLQEQQQALGIRAAATGARSRRLFVVVSSDEEEEDDDTPRRTPPPPAQVAAPLSRPLPPRHQAPPTAPVRPAAVPPPPMPPARARPPPPVPARSTPPPPPSANARSPTADQYTMILKKELCTNGVAESLVAAWPTLRKGWMAPISQSFMSVSDDWMAAHFKFGGRVAKVRSAQEYLEGGDLKVLSRNAVVSKKLNPYELANNVLSMELAPRLSTELPTSVRCRPHPVGISIAGVPTSFEDARLEYPEKFAEALQAMANKFRKLLKRLYQ